MPLQGLGRAARLATATFAVALVAGCSGGTAPPPSASAKATATASASVSGVPSCSDDPAVAAELSRLAKSGPASAPWVGMNIDWGNETVADVTSRLGRPPAVVVSFVAFPLAAGDIANLDSAAGQAHDSGAVLVVTLEPWSGLAAVTDDATTVLIERLVAYGRDGVPTIIRFAHEMNGSWYPWGQDPDTYVAVFRRVADWVHGGAPTAAMLWAPNEGEGYPFSGLKYVAKPGSPAAKLLDTNGDGKLDASDDPYRPYWPGERYVDWVGMSLYHWGTTYPWRANVVPPAGKFARLLTGASTTAARVPDFYAEYAEKYDKPLAIVETAALYRPGGGGATEASIKEAWLR